MSVVNNDQLDISFRYNVDPIKDHPKTHKTKISLLFALPLIFFFIASIAHIQRLSEYTSQLTELDNFTNQAIELSNLLHELQKERGMTGIYIASAGRKFKKQLLAQQNLTDSEAEKATQLTIPHKANLNHVVYEFKAALEQLLNIRNKVSKLELDTHSAISSYSKLNLKIINIINEMGKENIEPELNRMFLVYAKFLKKKEIIGVERALLSTVFTENYFTAENYKHFVKLVTEQELLQRELMDLASPELKSTFIQLTQTPIYQEVQLYRELAHSNVVEGNFNIDPSDWFNVITNKINGLKNLEDEIAATLIKKSKNIKANSEREKFFWQVALMCITFLAVAGGVFLIRNINLSFLRQLEAYRLLFENSAEAMVVINSYNKNILYCNTSFSTKAGCTPEEVSQFNFIEFLSKNAVNEFSGQLESLINGHRNFLAKVPFKNRDGREWFAEISAFPLLIEGRNYIAANIKDITAKLDAEEKLQKSEQTLQTVLDSLNSAVTVIDTNDQKTLYLNKKAEEIYKARDEIEPVWSLLTPSTPRKLQPSVHSLGEEFSEQVFNKSRKRWYQISNKIIDWFDNRVVYLRMLEDITERYEIEHKNQNLLVEIRKLTLRNYNLQEVERKQLAAELHDQLGQLMTGIMLQADFINQSMQGKNQEVEVSVKSIITTTKELINSVRGITNHLRPILLDQLGLVEALRELIQQWQQMNSEVRFEFNAEHCPSTLPDQITINVFRIVQESLTNACKHAKAKQITVSLEFETSADQKVTTSLILNISDDGIGFNNNGIHYTGMGLVSMRERVEALGGEFRLFTKSGMGVNTHAFIPLSEKHQDSTCR